jgi:hypothetical protein
MKKTNFKIVYVLFFILLLFGCTSIDRYKPDLTEDAKNQRERIIGRWFGESKTKDGFHRMWIDEERPDGTFIINFRTYDKNRNFEEQTEIGIWGISGPIYFTIIKKLVIEGFEVPVDPANPYYYDAYEVLTLTNQDFEYCEIATGNIFKAKRVSENFILPNK